MTAKSFHQASSIIDDFESYYLYVHNFIREDHRSYASPTMNMDKVNHSKTNPGYIFFGEVVAVRMEKVLGVIVLYSLSKEFFFQQPGRKCHHLSCCFRSRANGVNIVFNKK